MYVFSGKWWVVVATAAAFRHWACLLSIGRTKRRRAGLGDSLGARVREGGLVGSDSRQHLPGNEVSDLAQN